MNLFKEVSIKNWLLIFAEIILFSFLQSCAGTNFGKRLTNSFDIPLQDSDSLNNMGNRKIDKDNQLDNKGNNQLVKKDVELKSNNISYSSNEIKKVESSYKDSKSFKLKPYRIIIRLYEVDPSAPAQIVTSALRDAGVRFEVERIEKFDIENKVKNSFER